MKREWIFGFVIAALLLVGACAATRTEVEWRVGPVSCSCLPGK
jgi:hypothetical protein